MLRVTISGRDEAAMVELVRRFDVDIVRWTLRPDDVSGGYRVDAVVDEHERSVLAAAGYRVDVVEDIDVAAALRGAEIDWHPRDAPGGPLGRPAR